jgi:hypothetical protein
VGLIVANNRMFLKCDKCGAHFCIGKRMGSGYYILQQDSEFYYLLLAFFDEHEFCKDAELDCFSLEYQIERNSL